MDANVKEEISENSFCCEFDNIALKINPDYQKTLEAIFVLQHQRAQAIKDLDTLYACQEQALADPLAFVEDLQKGKGLKIPRPIKIHPLPVIDWSKYALTNNGRKKKVELSNRILPDFIKNEKVADNHKKKMQNQYWTAEEQKKLEELLIKFPTEEVETRRWKKIASCLENRTPVQVATRVQKYFIKLMKAGLPIPGRMPNSVYNKKKPRRNVIRREPSTFMVSYTPPVYMTETDDDYNYKFFQPRSPVKNSLEHRPDVSDNEELNPDDQNISEHQELMLLKKILKEKQKLVGFLHNGSK